jgi:SET domain-containing protein
MMTSNSTIPDTEMDVDKRAFLENVNRLYANDTVYVSVGRLGYCLLAKRPIRKGELISTFSGAVISFQETTTKGELECMSLQFDHDKYIDTEPPARFANHSCEPNVGIANKLDLIAIADIGAGEEILFDYSTTMDEDHYQMECKCGKPGCRKVVTDFKLLPKATREKYLDLNIVSDFIRKQYRP